MSEAAASASAAGRRAAASYLRELLLRPGSYRRLWEQNVVRARPGEVNQMAVAEVLARRLWYYPRGSGDADVLPHQLKDTVSRAMSGRLLSRSTLALFIEAFRIDDTDADRLWRLWEGSAAITVLTGPRAMGTDTEDEVRAVLGPRRHQSVSLHDHVHVGPDRRLARARTLQVIEAIADDVDRIPFLYDTNALALEVGQGCRKVSGGLYEIRPGVFATDLLLARVLGLGETTTLEYWTTYRYPGDPADPHEREYRRAVMGRLENFDMRVEFHPGALPASVRWATWDGVDGDILAEEKVSLDSQHSAHRYLRFISKTVAGFYWTWT
ncbi:MAG: hypothetical protein ACLPUO_08725 [Streptosporangiaceae bacterium]